MVIAEPAGKEIYTHTHTHTVNTPHAHTIHTANAHHRRINPSESASARARSTIPQTSPSTSTARAFAHHAPSSTVAPTTARIARTFCRFSDVTVILSHDARNLCLWTTDAPRARKTCQPSIIIHSSSANRRATPVTTTMGATRGRVLEAKTATRCRARPSSRAHHLPLRARIVVSTPNGARARRSNGARGGARGWMLSSFANRDQARQGDCFQSVGRGVVIGRSPVGCWVWEKLFPCATSVRKIPA